MTKAEETAQEDADTELDVLIENDVAVDLEVHKYEAASDL